MAAIVPAVCATMDGTYDEDAGPDNQCLYLNGTRVAQMNDTLPLAISIQLALASAGKLRRRS